MLRCSIAALLSVTLNGTLKEDDEAAGVGILIVQTNSKEEDGHGNKSK